MYCSWFLGRVGFGESYLMRARLKQCPAQCGLAGCTCNANTLKFMANKGEVSPWFVTRKRLCYIERCPIYQGTHSFLEYLVHSLLSDVNCGGFVSNFLVVLMFLWAVVVQLPTTIRVLQETGWTNDKQEPYELTCVLGPATTPQQHLDKVNLAIDRQNEWVIAC